jgi:drug/metabolite transporter (DMT)-like permease
MNPTGRKIDWLATSCLLCAQISWALVPVFLRYLADYIDDGWTTNGARYPIGAVLYLPFLAAAIARGQLTRRLMLVALIPAGINIAGQTLWAWCPYFIDPGLLSFLIRSVVLWSAIGSFIMFHDERTLAKSKRFWGGIALAIVGLTALAVEHYDESVRATLIGIMMAIACAASWSAYGIGMRIIVRSTSVGLAFSIISIYTGAACIVMMCLWGDARQLIEIPLRAQIVLTMSAVLGIALAHGLFYIAIRRLGVSISYGTGMATPFVTYGFSYMLFGEHLTGLQWGGGFVLITGASLLIWAQQQLGPAHVDEVPASDHRPVSATRSNTSS